MYYGKLTLKYLNIKLQSMRGKVILRMLFRELSGGARQQALLMKALPEWAVEMDGYKTR